MKWINCLLLASICVAATGCKKPGVVLRDPEVYKNEITFFQMALEQDTDLLAEHLADGTCSCDDSGTWNNVLCEDTALNVLVIQHRLQYHVDLALYNAGMKEERPPKDPPEVPEPSTLCPSDG
jgi:hypothetical protein